MKNNTLISLFALALLALSFVSCDKPAEEATKTGAAQTPETAEPVKLADQEQAPPDPEKFRKSNDERGQREGTTSELPASWPANLRLPDGASVTQANSREGTDIVEFTVKDSLASVSAHLSNDAANAGFSLRQASVDKYNQSRTYTKDDIAYSTAITQVEDECFCTLNLTPASPNQYFSESTNYTGEFSLPNSWPDDILPIYEGAVLRELHVPINKGGRLMLNAQTTDSEATVISWLETSLPALGWTLSREDSRNGFTIRFFDGNGYSLSAAARENGGVTDIQYEADSI